MHSANRFLIWWLWGNFYFILPSSPNRMYNTLPLFGFRSCNVRAVMSFYILIWCIVFMWIHNESKHKASLINYAAAHSVFSTAAPSLHWLFRSIACWLTGLHTGMWLVIEVGAMDVTTNWTLLALWGNYLISHHHHYISPLKIKYLGGVRLLSYTSCNVASQPDVSR